VIPFEVGRRPTEGRWETVRLKDITSYVNRGVAPAYTDEPSGTVAFSQKCVRADRSVDPSLGRPMRPITEDKTSSVLREEDMCINSTGVGTLGRVGFIREIDVTGTTLVADGHVTVLRANPSRVLPRYLWYLLSTDVFYDVANASLAVGSTNQMELGRDSIRSLGIALPLAEEQRCIVERLDAELARIDELIAEQRRVTSLLEERRWSFIDTQFTNVGTETAPLSRFVVASCDGPFGSSLASRHYSNHGARVVRLGNLGRAIFKTDDQAFITLEYFESLRRHEVLPGDLLVAGLGDPANPVGRACVAPSDISPAIVKADCFRFRLDERRLNARFVALWFSSPRGSRLFGRAAKGSTRQRVNLGRVLPMGVPFVSLEIQLRLVAAVDEYVSDVSVLNRDISKQVVLLSEHRKALVTAAVTGGLDAMGKTA
jgi:type I restriction enzyme, S subunit